MARTLEHTARENTGREAEIDRLLHISTAEWLDAQTVLAEWSELDEAEQMDFLTEWPLAERRLMQLVEYAQGREMNQDQYYLFSSLSTIVVHLVPALNELFKMSGLVGPRVEIRLQ